tara:strand:+ start:5040 stop:5255 length:216 start_codon:yes stop_codon:yes gene_type:complete
MTAKDVKAGDTIKTWWGKMIVESTRIRYMKNGRKKIQFKGINLGGMGTIVGNVALDSKYEDTKVTVIRGGK